MTLLGSEMEVFLLSKTRVHELSKALGISNTQLLDKLKEMGIEAKNHMSGLEDSTVEKVKAQYQKNDTKTEKPKETKEDKKVQKPVNSQPQGEKQAERPKDNKPTDKKQEGKKQGVNGPRLFIPSDQRRNKPFDKNRGERKPGDDRNQRQGRGFDRNSQDKNNFKDRNFKDNNFRDNNFRNRPTDKTQGANASQDNKRDFKKNNFNPSYHKKDFDKKDFDKPQEKGNFRRSSDKPAKSKLGFETKPSREQRSQQEKKNNKNNKSENAFAFEGGNQSQYKNAKKNNKQKNGKGKNTNPVPEKKAEPVQEVFEIQIAERISIKDLAQKLKVAPSSIVMRLMKMGIMANINQEIDFDTVEEMCLEMNVLVEHAKEVDIFEEAFKEEEDDEKDLKVRPPVVVVMGHVDHGKTSLLDAIRHSNVTGKEAGGITQHIGAYTVAINKKPITFLDTPGHEAFTAMRMRGAQVTDIAILVVAADDGVMPQTIEAINHAKAAGVEIIVAINKIDKPGANPDRVKQELMEYGLIAEDWGGETICVPVSAATKEGIDNLLEMIILVAELKELKANPNKRARGNIIEAQLDKGRGTVATVLVQNGTLNVGDPIVAGGCYGKIRAMVNDKGQKVKKAGPSIPVEILGLNDVPMAGDMFYVAESERHARQVAESVVAKDRRDMIKETPQKVSLDDLFSQIESGSLKELNIVIKADVQGSVEAVKSSLEKLSNDEVRIRIIHGGVGAVTESDVMLASASNAIIIGFNVRPEASAKNVADEQKVDIRLYRVIYNAIEDITAAMKGLLDPIYEEKIIGHAEIRQLFKASKIGTIGGSYVTDGLIQRNCKTRILRDNIVVYDGELESLRRGKDDVKEVKTNFECGLLFSKFNDIKEGDVVEAYVMEEIKR